MIWLSGAVTRKVLNDPHMGVMLSPLKGNKPDLSGIPWAVDNGCFRQAHRFSLPGYFAYLERMADYRRTCLFATAPDVVADAIATWERSRTVLPVLRELGYPAALVAQDGIEHMRLEWDAFDALFLGGSTQWKIGPAAATLAAEARWRGKHVHMGRVNGITRLRLAHAIGCHSADGTAIAFAPDREYRKMRSVVHEIAGQLIMWRDTDREEAV